MSENKRVVSLARTMMQPFYILRTEHIRQLTMQKYILNRLKSQKGLVLEQLLIIKTADITATKRRQHPVSNISTATKTLLLTKTVL